MATNPSSEHSNNPFGQEQVYRPRVSISMMLLLFAITAMLCCMILLAWQTSGGAGSAKMNKTASLAFLIICYSAPLFLTAGVSLIYYAVSFLVGKTRKPDTADADSPFA